MFKLSMSTLSETAVVQNKKSAVIVGGGPVGLAGALMLEKCGWTDIKVIEKRASNYFESTKAYLYLVDRRGQRCTDLIGLTKSIANKGVSSLLYPGLNEVLTTGFINVKNMGGFDEPVAKYWIPRSELLDCFQEEILKSKHIKILYSSNCENINADDGNVQLTIKTINENIKTEYEINTIKPDLLLGCDGLNSMVRKFLESQSGDAKEKFTPTSIPSPAAGLKYKMLTLKNRFPLPVYKDINKKNDDTIDIFPTVDQTSVSSQPELSIPEQKYVFRSIHTDPYLRMNLGLLSVKGDAKRTANIICLPNHKIWTLKTFEEVKEFLVSSFPQIDFSTFVSDDEIARFASQSNPGEFPKPQYVKGLQQVFGGKSLGSASTAVDSGASEGKAEDGVQVCGVLLAGDAAHAFPPDLGQGVNSGFEDIFGLYGALEAEKNDIKKALPIYESARQPEAEALCKIMTFGFPYQYRQAPRIANFFLANFALRLALNKILPFIYSPPAFKMLQDIKLTYKDILTRADRTTRNIILSALFLVTLPWSKQLFSIAKWFKI